MELIDVIISKENLNKAYKKVKANKGAGGVDGMEVKNLVFTSGRIKIQLFNQLETEPICQSQ